MQAAGLDTGAVRLLSPVSCAHAEKIRRRTVERFRIRRRIHPYAPLSHAVRQTVRIWTGMSENGRQVAGTVIDRQNQSAKSRYRCELGM